MSDHLTTYASKALQKVSLETKLCPHASDKLVCLLGVQKYWGQMAEIIWPGYFDPTSSWTCEDECLQSADESMDCPSCQEKIQSLLFHLISPTVLDNISSLLAGPDYCADKTDALSCADFVTLAVLQGIPILVEELLADVWMQSNICNHAVHGTC